MKHMISVISETAVIIRNILIDTIGITTSKKKIRQVWQTPFYQNTYYLMSGNIINSALGFIFWIIAAKLYSAEVVGLGSAITSALRLLALFAELGLGISLVRYLPSAGKNGNGMINTCFTLSGLTAVIISLVFLSGLSLWSPALLPVRQDPLYFIAFIFFTFSMVLQPLALTALLARLQTRMIFIINVIAGILGIVLVGILSIFTDDALGLFSAVGLAITFTLILCVFWFLPRMQNGYIPLPRINLKILIDMGSYSAGNFVSKSLLLMTNFILPLIVVNTLGNEMNAYFYIPWSVGVVLQFVPAAISNSLFAEASNEETTLRANTTKSLKLVLLLLLPAALIIVVIANLILLLFGQEYSENGTLLLRILALSIIPWGINYIYIGIARVKKNIKGLIIIPAIASSLSLGLGYVLMVQIGLVGVGLGYLAGQGAVALPVLLNLWRSRNS
ncbi:lipopolysaccharide biosynthesis protein [Chloroflexota bacterium]